MRNLIPATLCLLLTATTHAGDTHGAATREWSDNTDSFRITAKLVDFDRDSKVVRLKLGSGTTVELPLRRLSPADQKYVNRQADTPLEALIEAKPRPFLKNVAGIDWVQTRQDASRAAFGGKSASDDKPIMCFRVLGDLEGFM